MVNRLVPGFRSILDRAVDAITQARLALADQLHGPYPETAADRLRAARLRRLAEEGRAIGLLDEGEDAVTLAWHRVERQTRRR